MARARNIKPGFFKNEILGVADPLYSLLFEGLWVLADRAGRLEDRPLRIKGEIFPYRDGLDMDAMLEWLQVNGFIQRYVSGGKKCILVLEFVKHQNPHKNEADSELPAPDVFRINSDDVGITSDFVGKTSENIGSTRADSLTTDSLIPDTPTLSAHTDRDACVLKPGEVCMAMKAKGIGDVNPGNADLLMLINSGADLAEFEGAATTATGKNKGFSYALGIVKRSRQEAASVVSTLHKGAMPVNPKPPPKTFAERDREAGWARWEEQTGRIHPERAKAESPSGQIIDITPRFMEIAQ